MLINLSNHPSEFWGESQLEAAAARFGSVVDIPFPAVDPLAPTNIIETLAEEYVQKCVDLAFQHPGEPLAVHVMGELTFTYLFVSAMEGRGIPCVASTTVREVESGGSGQKTSRFRYAKFRSYF